jgi:hypothetical protein
VRALPAATLLLALGAMLTLPCTRDSAAAVLNSELPGTFTETPWPFLLDQWGTGRAFRCESCGLALYVRAKVGFCNCTTGVVDDAEIDRVADFDLFPGQIAPLAPGWPVSVAWMKGRARAFQVDGPRRSRRYLLTIALSNKCDGVIATLVSSEPISRDAEQAALEQLASGTVLGWVETSTGLQ